MARSRRGERQEKEKDLLLEAIGSFQSLLEEDVVYNQEDLMRAYNEISIQVDETLAEGKMTPAEGVDLKLAVTKDTQVAAHQHGDETLATTMTQTVSILETLQSALQVPEVSTPPEPAQTPPKRTSAAKSS